MNALSIRQAVVVAHCVDSHLSTFIRYERLSERMRAFSVSAIWLRFLKFHSNGGQINRHNRTMSTQAKTERAKYLFRASEYGDGTAFVSTELIEEPGLTVLANAGFLAFDLRDDSLESAYRLADLLNEYVKSTSVTAFENHPLFAQMKNR